MMYRFAPLMIAAVACMGQEVNPKGVFVTPANDPAARPAVKYSIKLNRNGDVRPVAASYRFQTGDKFQFLFESNQSNYVYVLHRAVEGDPDRMEQYAGAKGIIVTGGDNKADQRYQVLWPTSGAVKITANKAQSMPSGNQFFEFDAKPGLEKIVLVVSPQPIDVAKYFNVAGNANSGSGGRKDKDEDVLGQLTAMDKNTVSVADATDKGICVGSCDGYSAPRDPGKPFLVNIDLRHFR